MRYVKRDGTVAAKWRCNPCRRVAAIDEATAERRREKERESKRKRLQDPEFWKKYRAACNRRRKIKRERDPEWARRQTLKSMARKRRALMDPEKRARMNEVKRLSYHRMKAKRAALLKEQRQRLAAMRLPIIEFKSEAHPCALIAYGPWLPKTHYEANTDPDCIPHGEREACN